MQTGTSPQRPSRRDALRLGALTSTGLALPALAGCSGGGLLPGGLLAGNQSAQGSAGVVIESAARLPEPFTAPLPIPPVLEPVSTDGDADRYELTQKVGQAQILPEVTTEVWGYDGIFPGPTLETRRGRETVVTHHNELDVPTVVHLHGGVTPAEHDGYPTDFVEPGSSREYVYPLRQRAMTLWYHDHRMDFTGPQVHRGLAGFHLIRDDEEDALGLPAGEREIPLMIVDRSFAEDGSFLYPSIDPTLQEHPGVEEEYLSGVLGDCILVNGAAWPILEVTNTMYRFRLLNASNARRYELALDPPPADGASFVQIGSDGGLLAAPVAHESIEIAQAERFDVVVDFSAYSVGDEVTLVNRLGQDGTGQVMRFVVAREGPEEARIPETLSEITPLSRDEVTVEREFVFQRGGAEHEGMTLWTINGEPFDPDRIEAAPQLGEVELWRIRALNLAHPFHVHLSPFQVLSTGGGDDPGPYNSGWKDTVNLGSGGEAEILVRFEQFTGKFVVHCHNLEHEDMMMMANFEVS
ncbi:multicopper oxidase family protein [Brachybacterium sp. GCM10030267]|uniref:multicopper oxidase family protein n=1 Tax=Brachybacterium sp. GCM10030267 TaxID=3273381 RepID=UPI003615400E